MGVCHWNWNVLDLELRLAGDRLVGLFIGLVIPRVDFGLSGELNNSVLDELFVI